MSVKLDIKLRILRAPTITLKCVEEYTLPKSGDTPVYGVCISEDKYIVYDLLTLDKDADKKIKRLEEELYEIIMVKESLTEELNKIKDVKLRCIAERQLMGYGVIEPFFLDPDIINMHILADKPIQVLHRLYGPLESSITLSEEEVKELAMRLAATAGKPLSEAIPLASFIEPRYEARITIVYLSDITMRRGIIVDIRKPPENPWTILKLIHLGTLSFEEAAFLWLMVKYKVPIIIVGEIMTGKTTLASALLSLVPPKSRVMTIEDTPELRLPVTYWTRTTVRDFGEYKISVFDLVKTSVRLSLDYIIIGEIRGEEAREWANAILLGHGAVTTFHAESPEAALLRLLSPPISVDPQVIRLLNIFVKTNAFDKPQGRIYRHEIYVHENGRVIPLFVYNSDTDNITLNPDFKNPLKELTFIDRIVRAYGISREILEKEYEAMIEVLTEVYNEHINLDPNIDNPSYKELPIILYNKLQQKLLQRYTYKA
ncbi:MAG: type II/IV secretion system ATPase subunit [Ignisphaera sp.]